MYKSSKLSHKFAIRLYSHICIQLEFTENIDKFIIKVHSSNYIHIGLHISLIPFKFCISYDGLHYLCSSDCVCTHILFLSDNAHLLLFLDFIHYISISVNSNFKMLNVLRYIVKYFCCHNNNIIDPIHTSWFQCVLCSCVDICLTFCTSLFNCCCCFF